MHIIALLLAALGGAGAWYWHVRSIAEAGRDVANVAAAVRGAHRRAKFRRKVETSPLASISDPATAAAVFLHALANENRQTLHLSEPAIREHVGAIVDAPQLDEVLTYAQWVAREVTDPRDVVRRFKPLWRETLTRDERTHLIAMAEAVIGLSDRAEHNQKLSVATLRTALSPEQIR